MAVSMERPPHGLVAEKAPLPAEAAGEPKRTARLVSLDAFRGGTILAMLLVNNASMGEATPRHLTHAEWSGRVHLADLVFPWFLFIVGVAIPWAAASHRRKGGGTVGWAGKVMGRAMTLFALGCLVNSAIARQPVWGLGVLQIIGLAYLVSALLSPLPILVRGALALVFLLGHWGLIRFAPIPGVGAGQFTETSNIVAHVNQTYLAPLGLSGLLSLIPTSALALIGTVFGDVLRREKTLPARRAAFLMVAGAVIALLGLLISLDLPMNKPLWTASYILFAGGLGALTLGGMVLVMDVWGLRALAFPLVVPGMNAIVAYVAPILVKTTVLQTWVWPSPNGARPTLEQALRHACFDWAGRTNGGWLYTLGYIAFWWLVLFWLYRKQVFLRA